MSERLTDEQLQAIRERARLVVLARERENEANRRMIDNRYSEPTVRTFQALQEIRIEAEEDLKYYADEDVPALLAHIYALEAELAAALSDDEPALAFKPTAVRTFRLTEVVAEDAD